VDLILAEDTRVSRKLLTHFQIDANMRSFHIQNEHKTLPKIIDLLSDQQDIALITDAGTPGISDPGYLLIKACIDKKLAFTCLPGATAFVPALVMSGLPSHHFHFEGFLPHKKGRKTRLMHLASLSETFVLYESPNRIEKCVQQLIEHCGGDRRASLSREISKMYEENVHGSLVDLLDWCQRQSKIRGEFVLVIEGLK
ncbi:MAG: 16S rRNA (cytidine(1402)-2'-O)-methyltransferase, partial [Saprospiraceae bacterium]|nr:16S rRNA (cytidine(1402)-2'-O)-methyltransferase [Saprospiraceae bacterium]